MTHITLDDEQAKLIAEASGIVEIRDREGNRLGYVAHRFTDSDIALARARLASDEPRLTTLEVLDRLRSMEQQ